jgi:hypothetical protein
VVFGLHAPMHYAPAYVSVPVWQLGWQRRVCVFWPGCLVGWGGLAVGDEKVLHFGVRGGFGVSARLQVSLFPGASVRLFLSRACFSAFCFACRFGLAMGDCVCRPGP